MNTAPTIAMKDEELVELSRRGDKDAFVLIVERHLGAVSAVAYSLTGDLDRSEDLAQETFLKAWKRLHQLREPGRLKPWLCGIARNLGRDLQRRQPRDVIHGSVDIDAAAVHADAGPSPRDVAVREEQDAMIWTALDELPESLREPLVLFYREDQSIRAVSEALDITESVAKQRLNRGRNALRESVAAMIEETLPRTAPSKALVVAITGSIAGLSTTPAWAAGIGTAAGKGTAPWLLGIGGTLMGPILGIAGGYYGIRTALKNARCEEERRELIRSAWSTTGLVIGWVVLLAAIILSSVFEYISVKTSFILGAILLIVYGVCLTTLIVRSNRRVKRIREKHGERQQQEDWDGLEKMTPAQRRKQVGFAMGGSFFGLFGYAFGMGGISGDFISLAGLAFLCLLLTGGGIIYTDKYPGRYFHYLIASLILTLPVQYFLCINMFDRWVAMGAAEHTDASAEVAFILLTVIHLALAGLFLGILLRKKKREKQKA